MVKAISPLLVAISEANIENVVGDDDISNEIDFNFARGQGLAISYIVGSIQNWRQFQAADADADVIRHELDLDPGNTSTLGVAATGIVDTEEINGSRIAIMDSGSSVQLVTSGFHATVPVVTQAWDFGHLEIGQRPLTTRNMRHHVRRVALAGQRNQWAVRWMWYYQIVELTNAELVSQVISERSF